MLNKLTTRLQQDGALNGELDPLVLQLTETVTGRVSQRMKLAIAVSEIILYASQFRRYIKLPADDKHIPINGISIVLASSGASKDRTVNAVRGAFKSGYKLLDIERKKLASEQAIKRAEEEGVEDPEKWENHKSFYTPPPTLFAAMTNEAAYLDHLASIEALPLGAGFTYAGELATELDSNPDIIPAIKVAAEVYDVGYRAAKPLKDKGNQTAAISNLATSALFVGSYDGILYNEKVKTTFKIECTSKLARRSWLTFCPEDVAPIDYGDGDDAIDLMFEAEEQEERDCIYNTLTLDEKMKEVAVYQMRQIEPLTLEEDARKLYRTYTNYNDYMSRIVKKQYPLAVLVRKHNQWKTLKLAGALAIINKQDTITKENLIHAISFTEEVYPDMEKFEAELIKEKYEEFSDYMQYLATTEGKSSMSLHALKKLQYIKGTANPTNLMRTLCELASSYDTGGIYSVADNTIYYERIKKTEVTGASFLVDDYSELAQAYKDGASKDTIRSIKMGMAARSLGGYTYAEVAFSDLAGLLNNDVAFATHEFKTPESGAVWDKSKNAHLPEGKGVRGRDNVIGGTTWICFDVDDGVSTASEMHDILGDINHHIALTSNPENEYKYRIILQLDAYVTLEPLQWKFFLESISDYLMIPIDNVPQSQIMFGYADRGVLTVTDQNCVEVRDHLTYGINKAANKGTPEKELTAKEKAALLDSKFTTFEQAFMCPHSRPGSRALYAAAKKAVRLGMPKDDICDLLQEISDYWESPFPQHRLDALCRQVQQPNF